MKEQKKDVLVLADFARLTKKQFSKVYEETTKKYPKHVILPNEDFTKDDGLNYVYHLCMIERIVAIKPSVAVMCTGKSGAIRTVIEVKI
jgi:hypothetical protein